MKDSIKIDGRIYISSRRAAEISKYSNDYIGQLCRGGKVASQMMGRTWFVDQQSLLAHKKASEDAFDARCKMASRDHKSLSEIRGLPRESSFSVPMRRAATAALMAIIITSGGFLYYGQMTSNRSFMVSGPQTASASEVIGDIFVGFKNAYRSVVAYVNGLRSSSPQYVARTDVSDVPWNGMAVVPSSPSTDAESERRIRSSFSDPVEITADESGTAGVIKPVFKDTNGDDFLYVLVPVKEEKK